MSAARLAAEAAFAAPALRPPQPVEVQITLRRARGAEVPPFEPELQPKSRASQTSADTPSAAKAPRVFRVETAQTPRSQETAPAGNGLPHEDALRDRSLKPQTTSQKRRKAKHMQPGPVLHVVHTLAVPGEAEQARPRLDLMAAELVRIGKVLDEAKRAESLRFVPSGFSLEWERLWCRAENIHQYIKTQWR
jgi:hypothetical protein